MSADMYSTSGSADKIKICIENALKAGGFDPSYAHNFTVYYCRAGERMPNRPRILIEIEPRAPNAVPPPPTGGSGLVKP